VLVVRRPPGNTAVGAAEERGHLRGGVTFRGVSSPGGGMRQASTNTSFRPAFERATTL